MQSVRDWLCVHYLDSLDVEFRMSGSHCALPVMDAPYEVNSCHSAGAANADWNLSVVLSNQEIWGFSLWGSVEVSSS